MFRRSETQKPLVPPPTTYKPKHKISYIIETSTAPRPGGGIFEVWMWETLIARYEGPESIERGAVATVKYSSQEYVTSAERQKAMLMMACCCCTCGLSMWHLNQLTQAKHEEIFNSYILPKLYREADQEIDRRIEASKVMHATASRSSGDGVGDITVGQDGMIRGTPEAVAAFLQRTKQGSGMFSAAAPASETTPLLK